MLLGSSIKHEGVSVNTSFAPTINVVFSPTISIVDFSVISLFSISIIMRFLDKKIKRFSHKKWLKKWIKIIGYTERRSRRLQNKTGGGCLGKHPLLQSDCGKRMRVKGCTSAGTRPWPTSTRRRRLDIDFACKCYNRSQNLPQKTWISIYFLKGL